jgi:hypothetical protein
MLYVRAGESVLVYLVGEHVFCLSLGDGRIQPVSSWARVSPFRRTSIANVFLP